MRAVQVRGSAVGRGLVSGRKRVCSQCKAFEESECRCVGGGEWKWAYGKIRIILETQSGIVEGWMQGEAVKDMLLGMRANDVEGKEQWVEDVLTKLVSDQGPFRAQMGEEGEVKRLWLDVA